MNSRLAWIADRSFWWVLLLGAIDRLIVLLVFGFNYIGDDDSIIWSAAVDYGHGIFREPYFYGQDYSPMLEALIAAPLLRLGLPLHGVMPIVTSLLALLPYWSFAIWHHLNKRPLSAILFAMVPILLPIEFGLMTTMTRGFVTGIAPLAALPWILDIRRERTQSLMVGMVISIAWFLNPNSLVFSIAFLCWYLLSGQRPIQSGILVVIGSVTGISVHLAAQAYCSAHRDRLLTTLYGSLMEFDMRRIGDALSALDAHFAWLVPILWPYGQVAGELLILLVIIAIKQRSWPAVVGLTLSLSFILISLGFKKTHDGELNVFFPLSRMYIALPLLLCWGGSMMIRKPQENRTLTGIILLAAVVVVLSKALLLPSTLEHHLAHQGFLVFERPLSELRSDEHLIRAICEAHDVQLIVAQPVPSSVCAQFRSYLYPVLDPTLPPTYRAGYERRYWQREAIGNRVFPNVLLTAGDPERWKGIMASDPRFIDVSDGVRDQMHVIVGNTEPTDTLVSRVLRDLKAP